MELWEVEEGISFESKTRRPRRSPPPSPPAAPPPAQDQNLHLWPSAPQHHPSWLLSACTAKVEGFIFLLFFSFLNTSISTFWVPSTLPLSISSVRGSILPPSVIEGKGLLFFRAGGQICI